MLNYFIIALRIWSRNVTSITKLDNYRCFIHISNVKVVTKVYDKRTSPIHSLNFFKKWFSLCLSSHAFKYSPATIKHV